jgi:hypothetical protein
MLQLRTHAQYKITIVSLQSFRSKFMNIQTLYTCSLVSHFEDVFAYPNLLTSHFFLFKWDRSEKSWYKFKNL